MNLQKYGRNTETFDVKRFSTDENPDNDVGDTVIVTISAVTFKHSVYGLGGFRASDSLFLEQTECLSGYLRFFIDTPITLIHFRCWFNEMHFTFLQGFLRSQHLSTTVLRHVLVE